MSKEKYHLEIDKAFEIYEMLKDIDFRSWHRIIALVEQLRQEDQRQIDEIQKAVYAAGRPIGV